MILITLILPHALSRSDPVHSSCSPPPAPLPLPPPKHKARKQIGSYLCPLIAPCALKLKSYLVLGCSCTCTWACQTWMSCFDAFMQR